MLVWATPDPASSAPLKSFEAYSQPERTIRLCRAHGMRRGDGIDSSCTRGCIVQSEVNPDVPKVFIRLVDCDGMMGLDGVEMGWRGRGEGETRFVVYFCLGRFAIDFAREQPFKTHDYGFC